MGRRLGHEVWTLTLDEDKIGAWSNCLFGVLNLAPMVTAATVLDPLSLGGWGGSGAPVNGPVVTAGCDCSGSCAGTLHPSEPGISNCVEFVETGFDIAKLRPSSTARTSTLDNRHHGRRITARQGIPGCRNHSNKKTSLCLLAMSRHPDQRIPRHRIPTRRCVRSISRNDEGLCRCA